MDRRFPEVIKLHKYLVARHWDGRALIGPDPGIRFNYRIGRFMKSYLRRVKWNDDYYYLQAQGYWVLGNWRLFTRTGEEKYREIAVRCSEYMLERQRGDGAWDYPNPEWKGRVATAEGTWGALGLLESSRQTADTKFLGGALSWHRFLTETIGYQKVGSELSVNYFAHRDTSRVPNNSAFVLRFLAELADLTGDQTYLEPAAGLLTFLRNAQKPTGEFPYAVEGPRGGPRRPHFQCYQYNAFQGLDLMKYYEKRGDESIFPLVRGVLSFLSTGLGEDGHAFYDCHSRKRAVTYHTAVLGAPFRVAGQLGLDGDDHLASRAYHYVLGLQRPDGGFPHSRGEYQVLSDQRSYPRYLAMILYHLLIGDPATEGTVPRRDTAHAVVR